MTEPRRFVQIHCASNGHYVAVADDGTAWEFKRRDYSWIQLPALPHHVARRPKLPSLAEQALEALEQIDGWEVSNMNHLSIHDDLVTGVEAIRTALERLKELEKGNG